MISIISKFLGSKLSGYIALGLLAALIAGGLYIRGLHARIDALKAEIKVEITLKKQAQELADQNMSLFNACKTNFKINKKVSDAYFQQNLDLRNRVAADKRLLKNSCASIPTAAGADDPAPEGYVWKGQVSVADSLDYYAECGEIENRLLSLQSWVNNYLYTAKP